MTIRKQESVHLHALLVETAEYLQADERTAGVDLAEYEALAIGPSSIHRSKSDHTEAILVLAAAIERSLDRSADADHPPRPR